MFFDIGFTSGDIISYIIPVVKAFLKKFCFPCFFKNFFKKVKPFFKKTVLVNEG